MHYHIVGTFAQYYRERRILIENMVESVTVFPEHMEVKVVGSPALHVLYSEVGLKGSENVQVGGPMCTISDWRVTTWFGY